MLPTQIGSTNITPVHQGVHHDGRLAWRGALTDATQAATLSPHYGDAWKLWGDVLAKQGHAKEALAKYDEAMNFAPNSKQLKEAREALPKQKS